MPQAPYEVIRAVAASEIAESEFARWIAHRIADSRRGEVESADERLVFAANVVDE